MNDFFNVDITELQSFQWFLIYSFIFLFLIRFLYLILFYGRILFYKLPAGTNQVPVSVLLPFRNEEENLRVNLPSLLSNTGAEFEVVAVDDFSSDNSYMVISDCLEKYKNFKVTSLNQETRFSEKLARNIAIKATGYDWVVLIPPAAEFADKNWVSSIASKLDDKYEVVAGYSGLKPNGSLGNLLYRAEAFFQQITGFGFVINGMPYIANEENVAFKKQNYFDIGGYGTKIRESNLNLELLINTFIKKKSTLLLISGDYSLKMNKNIELNELYQLSLKEFRLIRQLNAGTRLFRAFVEISSVLFLPVAISAFIFVVVLWPFFSFLILLYVTAYIVIIKKIQRRLEETKLLLTSLLIALLRPYIKLFLKGLHYFAESKR